MAHHPRLWLAFSLAASLASCHREIAPVAAAPPTPPSPPLATASPAAALAAPRPSAPTPIADAYRAVAEQILTSGRASTGAYDKLAYLTDRVGHRIAGSKQLEQAVAWAEKALRAEGHENVRAEKAMVDYWERGEFSLEILAPTPQRLAGTALGLSPGTTKNGVTAEVVVVD